MDAHTRRSLLELPRLSQKVMNNLSTTMKALARVSLNSPEFNQVLKNSKEANEEAQQLLMKQREVIKGIKR
jgi:hypothetical protein